MTKKSIEPSLEQIGRLKKTIEDADAVVVGAGAGLSTSAGLTYSGERFERYFSDFIQKYHIPNMYSGGFYPFETLGEYWAWWSRHIFYNRYVDPPKPVYRDLLELIKEKDYFILTTNVDHQFQRAGFDKKGSSIPKVITACGNARSHAARRPGTTRKPSGAWSLSSEKCVFRQSLSLIARFAVSP